MSNEFDKEAEREKLREKLADDEEKREHTQQMSELLLQGATMTNRHCDACGDPIFRHDGREFCPTCHATEDGYAVPADGEPTPTGTASDGTTANGSRDTAETGRTETTEGTTGEPRAATTPDSQPTATGPDQAPTSPDPAASGPDPAATTPSSGSTTTPGFRSGESGGSSGDLDDARSSLTRTLTRFARAAEATDDPRRARDHLEAAREAAAALSVLDR